MATITIRNLDEATKRGLRIRAAENGRSMEEEVRKILEAVIADARQQQGFGESGQSVTLSWVDRIVARFAEIGGVELELPPPQPARLPPDFSGPEFDR
ncbi:MAG: plasmid stabilization protein [Rhizobiales bacterium]|nr:plasmid stabilization protein [Hyphomicrobiales bacterium]MBI3673148.1 plasmid stabilization protein [Hyphomicrobiales bacterium]